MLHSFKYVYLLPHDWSHSPNVKQAQELAIFPPPMNSHVFRAHQFEQRDIICMRLQTDRGSRPKIMFWPVLARGSWTIFLYTNNLSYRRKHVLPMHNMLTSHPYIWHRWTLMSHWPKQARGGRKCWRCTTSLLRSLMLVKNNIAAIRRHI